MSKSKKSNRDQSPLGDELFGTRLGEARDRQPKKPGSKRSDFLTNTFSKLDPEHKLFSALKKQNPPWWWNLVNDKLTYIEVRKGNYLDVYHNGGRILELIYTNEFKGKIHFEYVPLRSRGNYVPIVSRNGSLQLQHDDLELLDIEDFSSKSLRLIQKRIAKFYPPTSEKAIQADFRLNSGCFIDTEFQHNEGIRFDLVWIDIARQKLFAVELKTVGDQRLYFNEKSKDNSNYSRIDSQLQRYREFILEYSRDLVSHYEKVFQVKKRLNLLSPRLAQLDSLSGFIFEPRPILQVGNCTQFWIDQNKERLNKALAETAFGCFFQGSNTRSFAIPQKTKGNRFILTT